MAWTRIQKSQVHESCFTNKAFILGLKQERGVWYHLKSLTWWVPCALPAFIPMLLVTSNLWLFHPSFWSWLTFVFPPHFPFTLPQREWKKGGEKERHGYKLGRELSAPLAWWLNQRDKDDGHGQALSLAGSRLSFHQCQDGVKEKRGGGGRRRARSKICRSAKAIKSLSINLHKVKREKNDDRFSLKMWQV